MRRGRALLLLLPLALAATACGGGKSSYTLSAAKTCFAKQGYQATALANRYLPGSGGNLRVHLATQPELLHPTTVGRTIPGYVFLVFGKDAAEAKATEAKAITLTINALSVHGQIMTRAEVRDSVGLAKNVFFYSATGALTDEERSRVEKCLK